jgi:hypothetical protein
VVAEGLEAEARIREGVVVDCSANDWGLGTYYEDSDIWVAWREWKINGEESRRYDGKWRNGGVIWRVLEDKVPKREHRIGDTTKSSFSYRNNMCSHPFSPCTCNIKGSKDGNAR